MKKMEALALLIETTITSGEYDQRFAQPLAELMVKVVENLHAQSTYNASESICFSGTAEANKWNRIASNNFHNRAFAAAWIKQMGAVAPSGYEYSHEMRQYHEDIMLADQEIQFRLYGNCYPTYPYSCYYTRSQAIDALNGKNCIFRTEQ